MGYKKHPQTEDSRGTIDFWKSGTHYRVADIPLLLLWSKLVGKEVGRYFATLSTDLAGNDELFLKIIRVEKVVRISNSHLYELRGPVIMDSGYDTKSKPKRFDYCLTLEEALQLAEAGSLDMTHYRLCGESCLGDPAFVGSEFIMYRILN